MKVAVIGAGNGGQALAAFLSMRGADVTLFNRSRKRIAPTIKTRAIRLEGEIQGTFKISFATTDIEEAIKGRKLIMVVVPAFAHKDVAKKMAPYIEDGQVIILNPGRTAGAIEFKRTLEELGVDKDIIIAEAQTFIFASRLTNPGVAKIFRIKNAVPVSALPATKNDILEEVLTPLIPEFEIADNVIYTSFNNIGAVFHPAVLLLNAGRIESSAGKFEFYLEGITPSVARVLEKIDEERCRVMEALKEEPMTAKEWLNYAYDIRGEDLHEAIHNNPGYQGIMAPPSLANRYILEDVPMSLVPISSFGRMLGIPTPTIDSIIQIANVMMKKDFWKESRTVKSLGFEGRSVEEIRKYVMEGEL
ncbi:MAG: NAD/NADP octopine/nopaline dehydrogenase family protein [Thermotogaceae bacterium]|nr:NAD/NADP octopine/nopaline dehydrogenase family protein [Thermotogaceae bacterium]